ncbi:hypothetical protein ACN42_g2683 [Penicillium freii]|uniref:Uncharacterized protein n=1 Tax=Penicillium freii TaxID=48697 RepID=A0A101MPQ9_PENFR|nr:hypothetical protein ACN42_g2683 [Penicillium freii]
MTRCVKGSEFSHLELSMLWAGKLIHHVMPTSLANSPTADYFLYIYYGIYMWCPILHHSKARRFVAIGDTVTSPNQAPVNYLKQLYATISPRIVR